jgi:hypothetical protein
VKLILLPLKLGTGGEKLDLDRLNQHCDEDSMYGQIFGDLSCEEAMDFKETNHVLLRGGPEDGLSHSENILFDLQEKYGRKLVRQLVATFWPEELVCGREE